MVTFKTDSSWNTYTPTDIDGCVAYWDMTPSGGSYVVDSVGGEIGSLLSGASFTEGRNGSGVLFNGSTSYIQSLAIGSPFMGGPEPGSSWSVSAWINSVGSSLGISGATQVIATQKSLGDDNSFSVGRRTQDIPQALSLRLDDSELNTSDGIVSYSGAWQHVAASVSLSDTGSPFDWTGKIWHNGELIQSGTKRYATGERPGYTTTGGFIGWDSRMKHAFNGTIDEVAFYNKVLSNVEVEKLNGQGFTSFSIIKADENTSVFKTSSTNTKLKCDNNSFTLKSDLGLTLGLLPIAHYKLNDSLATTNVIDDIGNSDGTANFNTIDNSVVGKINTALNFNGTSEIVSSSNSILEEQGTICLWFNKRGVTGDPGTVAAIFNSDKHNRTRLTVTDGGGVAVVKGNPLRTVSLGSVNDDEWHHAVACWEETSTTTGNVWGYLDGVESAINTFTHAQQAQTLNRIGGLSDGNDNFNGDIDDVRLYNKILSSSEIKALVNNNQGTEENNIGQIKLTIKEDKN